MSLQVDSVVTGDTHLHTHTHTQWGAACNTAPGDPPVLVLQTQVQYTLVKVAKRILWETIVIVGGH